MRHSARVVAMAAAVLAAITGAPAMAGDVEAGVLHELNTARMSPQIYAARLRQYRTWFAGRVVTIPGADDPVLTREGVAAVDDAIRFLDRQRPLPALKLDSTLALAARDWVAAQGPRGGRGHFSPDGNGPSERVVARGGDKYVAENIAYGPSEADLVVLQLIVDDAVASRGHRKTIYDGNYSYAGTACGDHAVYRHMCVIDYSAFPGGSIQSRAFRVSR